MMQLSLRQIRVANFCGVRREVVLDFSATPSGLYFVRGENLDELRLGSNGSGKSSIFVESIVWVLTGCTTRSKRPSADVENRRSDGTTSVSVILELGSGTFTIERTRNPNNLSINGRKVEQLEVNRLLPLSDAALRKSLLIDQFGEMFLSLGPEAKSQIFTETLQLDRWLRAADAASDAATKLDKRLQVAVGQLQAKTAQLAEASDQREAAVNGEADFEREIKVLLKAARDRQEDLAAKVAEVQLELDDLRVKLTATNGEAKKKSLGLLEVELRRLRREELRATAQANSDLREVQRLMSRVQSYSDAGTECPECGQVVDAAHVAQKKKKLVAALAAAVKERREVSEEAAALGQAAVRTEGEIAALSAGLAAYNGALSEVAVSTERLGGAERELKRSEAEVLELKQRKNPFTEQCDALERRVAELKADRKRLRAEEAEASAELEVHKFWVKGFRDIRLEEIDAALLELEVATNRHVEALGLEDWQVSFSVERETKKGTVHHGFSVMLQPPGEDPVPFDTYSGGETQRLQLASTFGLAEVLLSRAGISPDFEIVDEPTRGLSPEGIDDLLTCLGDRARELSRRIFLIDHSALSLGSFDGVILIKKTKERGSYVADTGGVIRIDNKRVLLNSD